MSTKYDRDMTRLVGAGEDAAEPRPHFTCLGCGRKQVVVLPCLGQVFAAMACAWAKAHRGCYTPKRPAKPRRSNATSPEQSRP